jgi:hypothetical protein
VLSGATVADETVINGDVDVDAPADVSPSSAHPAMTRATTIGKTATLMARCAPPRSVVELVIVTPVVLVLRHGRGGRRMLAVGEDRADRSGCPSVVSVAENVVLVSDFVVGAVCWIASDADADAAAAGLASADHFGVDIVGR